MWVTIRAIFFPSGSINFQVNECGLVVASELHTLKAWHWKECHFSCCKIALCAAHLTGARRKYVFFFFGGMRLIERWDDLQGDWCAGHKWKYIVCNKCRKGNGKPVFGKVEKTIVGGRGGWKEKGHNIQMADWDLASWVGEKVTETNGFLCRVWLRGCTKPEIMCWYLLGAAWRRLIIISGPKTVEKPFTSLPAALSSPYMSWLCQSKHTILLPLQ